MAKIESKMIDLFSNANEDLTPFEVEDLKVDRPVCGFVNIDMVTVGRTYFPKDFTSPNTTLTCYFPMGSNFVKQSQTYSATLGKKYIVDNIELYTKYKESLKLSNIVHTLNTIAYKIIVDENGVEVKPITFSINESALRTLFTQMKSDNVYFDTAQKNNNLTTFSFHRNLVKTAQYCYLEYVYKSYKVVDDRSNIKDGLIRCIQENKSSLVVDYLSLPEKLSSLF